MEFCRLSPTIAAAVHVVAFVHPSVDTAAFIGHHTAQLGVPRANIHVLLHRPDVPYNSALKARAVNARLRALSRSHPRALVSQVDGDERLFLPCGMATGQTVVARMVDRVGAVCAPARAGLLRGYDRKIGLTPLVANHSVWQFVSSHSGQYVASGGGNRSAGGAGRYVRARGAPRAALEHSSFSAAQRALAVTKLESYRADPARRRVYETMLRINQSALVAWMRRHAVPCPSLRYRAAAHADPQASPDRAAKIYPVV